MKDSFIDETIEIQECQDSGQPSQSEKTTENDQVRRYSFEEVEECTLEEGLKISFKRVNHGLELAEKVEEKRVKQPIFYNTMEDDIEELKKDLNIEHDPTIHFIKGTFKGHYEEGDILGEGTTGTVKKCTKIGTNDSFAVKIVNYKGDTEMLVLVKILKDRVNKALRSLMSLRIAESWTIIISLKYMSYMLTICSKKSTL